MWATSVHLSFWGGGGGGRKWMTKNSNQGGFSVWCLSLILVRLCRKPGAGPWCFIFASSLGDSSNAAAAMPQPWNSDCPAETHSFNSKCPSSRFVSCLPLLTHPGQGRFNQPSPCRGGSRLAGSPCRERTGADRQGKPVCSPNVHRY